MSDLIQEAVAHLQRIREASADTPGYNEGFADGLDFCISFISTLPSAEPEQKTGTWEVQPSGEYEADFIWWKCSNCGQVIFSSSETDRRTFHAYCGRCGSKMY